MKPAVLVLLSITLLPAALAVDGVVLINQSTIMAAGGFPYKITQPGSYRLTGNLLADANKTAIEITSSNVSFDLNGFTIACNTVPVGLNPVSFFCVGNEPFGFSPPLRGLTVRNGSITVTSKGPALNLTLIFALSLIRDAGLFEGLQIQTDVDASYASTFYRIGPNSIIRSNIFTGASQIFTDCPSLVERNVNAGQAGRSQFSGCIFVNNIGLF